MSDVIVEEAPEAEGEVTRKRWHAVLIPLDTRSTDNREFAAAGAGWRDLPLPVMLLTQTAWGHDGARIAASMDEITVEDSKLYGAGFYDESPDGEEAARLVADQVLRWVSVDAEVMAFELIVVGEDGDEAIVEGEDELYDADFSDQIVYRATEWSVIGATICPFPAFPQAVIAPAETPLPTASGEGVRAASALGMTRSATDAVTAAANFPESPPAEWFDDPRLDGPTPFTVTDDGRVFGHLATWGTCHIGVQDACLTPSRSSSSYAYARTGEVVTADGGSVAVVTLTMDQGHAPLSYAARAAAEHYDDCRCGVADLAVGEDAHGIWVAGAVRPDVDPTKLRRLRAASLSGDWRRIGGNLELVAALAVNVPGYPIPRPSAYVASGQQQSLVAAGVLQRDTAGTRLADLSGRLARLERAVEHLNPTIAAAIRAEVHATS